MLIEFSVENFLSIKERVTLSMVASEDDEALAGNVIDAGNGQKLLKSAVIYGANASGKTNVLRALETMVDLVLNAHRTQKGDVLEVTPFKLDTEYHERPSRFEVVFLLDEVEYVYGFSVNSERVFEEYLYFYKGKQKEYIFDRMDSDEFTFLNDQEEQEVLSKRTLENALYLSIATQFNYEKTTRIYQWFKDTIKVETDTDLPGWREMTASSLDTERSETILEVLRHSGSGISSIDVQRIQGTTKSGRIFTFAIEINTQHLIKDIDGMEHSVQFELEDESKGTQKMFDLLGHWIYALQEGQILVMDELDTSLHPNLATELIKLFHDPERNKNNAQLIFTTHNTNLLDLDIFRRDQIWFTEKQEGATQLYSLYEFDDEHQDIERRYLVGRYGAVPTLREGLYNVPESTDQTQQEPAPQETNDTVAETQPGEDETTDGSN